MRRKEGQGEAMYLEPLGWRNAREAEGKSVVEPDSEDYRLVTEELRMRRAGHSIRTICRVMQQKGLTSKLGNRIKPSTMHLLLKRQSLLNCCLSVLRG